MIVSYNSAYRLHAILEKLLSSEDNQSLYTLWSNTFKVSNKDWPTLFRRLGQVFSLPEEVTRQLDLKLIDDRDLYLSWKQPVLGFLKQPNLSLKLGAVRGQLRPDIMVALKFCSSRIAESTLNIEIDDKEINNIIEQTKKLWDDVEVSSLSYETAYFIKERCVGIIDALEGCEICGPQGLENEFTQAVGSVALNHKFVDETKESEFGKRLWSVMGKYALIVTAISASLAIPLQIKELLPVSIDSPPGVEMKIQQPDDGDIQDAEILKA